MAEKIVILGNGFDLRHFLPTKYDHLITILKVIENIKFGNEVETDFDELFGNLFKEKDKWFYEKINEYYETKNIYFETVGLKSIQKRLKTNKWFQYLKSVEDNKIETWIDFETEINRVLLLLNNFFFSYNNLEGEHQFEFYNGYDSENSYFFIQNHLYKRTFSNKLQYNILLNFGLISLHDIITTLNENFTLIIDGEIQYFKEKIFFDSIYHSLEEFIGIFNDYIVFIVNKFYRYFKEEEKENFVVKNNKLLLDKIDYLYSFNYTDTFTKLYKLNGRNEQMRLMGKIIYNQKTITPNFLHGEALDDWKIFNDKGEIENASYENLKIVLGVDDIDDSLKSNKLFQFTKYFQKLHKNTSYLFLDDIVQLIEKPRTKHEDDYIFYFWGHSLDISDRDYINDVIKIVLSREDNKMIVFYHSISAKAELLKNLLFVIQDKNIIENLMKSKRLQFIESTPENLFKELA